MAEENINKVIRRCKEKSAIILDDESFNVAEARGKLSRIVDFSCFDKGVMKLVKVSYQNISESAFNDLLTYNDNQVTANTILQIFFWNKKDHKPFYRPKLFYNQPNQFISDDLKKLIK